MSTILLKIKALYENMGRGEKKIADFILQNPQEMIRLSISELAEKCGCGEATIVRFSRRLGLVGYQELKISIAQELNSSSAVPSNVTIDDSCYEVFLKRISDITSSLEHTKKVLDTFALEKAAKIISEATHIAIFGLGNSASVAMDAQHKFMRAGLNATAYCDNHMQAIAASHLKRGDVAIGISHSASSIDIVDALKLSRDSGAATISITNYGKSPIIKHSDIVLYTAAEETKYTILALSSRIAQLAIIDSLYTYLVVHKDKEVMEAIKNTERALQNKKY